MSGKRIALEVMAMIIGGACGVVISLWLYF